MVADVDVAGRTVQVQLCLDGQSRGQPVLAAVTRRWFVEGVPLFGGGLVHGLSELEDDAGELGSRWSGRPGDVWAECAMVTWQRDWGSYTQERWNDLLTAIDGPSTELAFTAYRLANPYGGIRCCPGDPRVSVTARYVDRRTGRWWSLKSQFSEGLVDEADLLAFVREVADSPSYGEISHDNASHIDHVTSLEHNLGMDPWVSVQESGRRLRGYSWLTIVDQGLGNRLGGLNGLRASGAWTEVEHLAHGGFWLLATRRMADFGAVEAAAVQAVLAPLLPPGQPRPDRAGEAPHLLALVDAQPSRRRAPLIRDDDVFDNRIDPRDSATFVVAVAVRMAALRERFPDALIWGATSHEDGPHLVCWRAGEGEVWVWRFVPIDDAYAGLDIMLDIQPDLAVVSEDPLSLGLSVIAGPTFADMGLDHKEACRDVWTEGQIVIYDDGPGRQLFYCEEDAEDPVADRTGEVMTGAADLKKAVDIARSESS